jgi:hypothetical protein
MKPVKNLFYDLSQGTIVGKKLMPRKYSHGAKVFRQITDIMSGHLCITDKGGL